jgi:hypothetical protein
MVAELSCPRDRSRGATDLALANVDGTLGGLMFRKLAGTEMKALDVEYRCLSEPRGDMFKSC